MSSLQEELARLGLAKEQPKKDRRRGRPKKPRGKRGQARAKTDPGDSLAAAYRARARAEQSEKQAAERAARERKARKAALKALLRKVAIDHREGQTARHFQHGDKIKRIYVNDDQLAGINAGELAIVYAAGRYHLIKSDYCEDVTAIGEDLFIFRESGDSAEADDGVPDDMVW